MTKNKIHIDTFFRRQLQGMQMPVGPAGWQAMQDALAAARKRRRRLLLLWWAGAALLLGALAGTWLLTGSNENPTVQNPTIEQNTHKSRETTAGRTESSIETDFEQATAAAQSQAKADVKNAPQQNAAQRQQNTGNNGYKTQGKLPSAHTLPVPAKQTPADQSITPQANGNTTGSTTSADTQTPEKPVAQSGQNDGAASGDAALSALPNDSIKPGAEVPTKVATIPPVDSGKTANNEVGKNKNDKAKGEDKAGSGSKGIEWYYGAKAGGMATQYHITSPNPHIDSIFNYGKNAGLSYSISFEGGLKLGRWTLGSGLGYTAFTKNSDFYYRKNIYDSVPVMNPQGQIIGYFHTNFRDTLMQRGLRSRTHYINIPVSATYHINIGKKLSLNLGASATVNINAGTGGQDVNPYDLNMVKAATLQSAARTFMLAAGGQAGLQYRQGNTAFFANVTYSRALTGMYKHDYLLAQRPRSIGLEAGIRFFIK